MDRVEEMFEAQLCPSLRRNDPETTELHPNHEPIPRAYGRRLGDALQGNTHVSSMDLSLDDLLAANEGVDSAASLLRYIRESASMRKIVLRCEYDPRRPEVVAALLRLALRAVAESSHIEELNLLQWDDITPPDAIVLLLRTTQSLDTLHIKLSDFDGVTSRELVAEAFGANRTLECLEIDSGSSTLAVESVLLHLGSHPVLWELQLSCGYSASAAQLRAMSHFLRATISLEILELCHCEFDKERMEYFVEGLQSSRSLTDLVMKRCVFDVEATTLFHGFMQTGETRSSIRELCFRNLGVDGMFEGETIGRTAAAFLTVPENHHMGSCIASSLQVLDFDEDMAGFYDTLAANAFKIRLPCVHHEYCSDIAGWEALTRCLPKLVYLRELRFQYANYIGNADPHQQDILARSFVDAVQQNGSLRVVEIGTGNQGRFFDGAQLCLIQSCCKRNEAIPTLAANPQPDATAIALFPKLFVAAMQARRTAPNAILVALLNAGNAIGPRQDRKRPHQEPSS